MDEVVAIIEAWDKYLFYKVSRLTPWRVANTPRLGKEFLTFLGPVIGRPIFPYEKKARLEALGRFGMDGRLGYIEYCSVYAVEGTCGKRILYIRPLQVSNVD